MYTLKHSVFLIAVASFVFSKSVANVQSITKESIWLPNPIGDGTLIEAILTPTEGAKAGDVSDIHFYLFTKTNKEELKEIDVNDLGSIDDNIWQTGAPLKLLIHGYSANINTSFPRFAKNAFVSEEFTENYNIIVMDYALLVPSPDFFNAVANAQIAAAHCATLLNAFVLDGRVTWADIHLIGFSLGGQIVGQIGYRVQQAYGVNIGRITGLDPGLPTFDVTGPENRTDSGDADFVDIIHTSANGIVGYYDAMGHIDWYPNGGRYQPGCGVDLAGSCGHDRAPAYYVESLTATPDSVFEGYVCDSLEDLHSGQCDNNIKQIMGHFTPTNARGVFFLDTKSTSPFSYGPLP